MADIFALAEALSNSHHRFLTDLQIGAFRRHYGASRDEVRTAAIIADRLRRQRQLEERPNGFRVEPQIAPDAPIVLQPQQKARLR
ncbi:hypothetical protein PMI07_002065 [Rhizobium sp. CF080]|uniref:hypothetical protein n=1 Tax=Rhizobium sp. (strain CF080) TaxID=1144310 RepID=UPI000271CE03|nr:hypothetical protein [Rhizobium sp. CF080]EUB95577.1 hypothetical protein PMI07_002065 [Rhizobium sp. CF080]